MNRTMLTEHLAQAEEHVALGNRHIVRQRELIAELARDGHDTAEAKTLLASFEEMQTLHLQHRDRLRHELARNP